ncbi:MAG: 4Fe-4S binding protein, partial [Candidatus Omnitrophota bacterium]
TREAAARGLGIADIKSISVAGERLEDVIGEPFILPSTSLKTKIPLPVIQMVRKLIKYYPYADKNNCTRCGYCIQACPNKVISMKNDRLVFNYSGCISCFCCQEACPHAAIKIKKSIVAKMIGL